MQCKTCEYWTRHDIGDCSQKMMSQSGEMIHVRTQGDYGCTAYEYENKQMDLRFWHDGKMVHHSGTTSEKYIKEIISYLQEIQKSQK